jgi:hypothetical protein
MIWGDVLVGADPHDHLIRSGLADVFVVPGEDIVLVGGVDELPHKYALAVVRYRIGGPQFPLQLSIYVADPALLAACPVPDALRRLSAEWDMPLLAPDDDSADPLCFQLYRPDGDAVAVSIDEVALEDRGEYLVRIDRRKPRPVSNIWL